MLEEVIVQTGGKRQHACAGQRDDADGADVERIDVGQIKAHGHPGADFLVRPAQRLENGDNGNAEPRFNKQRRQCCRTMLIRSKRQYAGAGV